MRWADPDVGATRSEFVDLSRDERGHTDLTVHMVSMWASRGWVDPATGQRRRLRVVGVDRDGTRRFHLGDLRAAEAATRVKTSRSHRRTVANGAAA